MTHLPKIILAATSLAALSACGQMEEGFNQGWDKAFKEECAKGAAGSGLDTAQIAKLCDCSATKLAEDLSTTEKMNPPQAKLMEVAQKCTEEMFAGEGATAKPE